MKVLVPLPIDLSTMANGRTLRVVNLLRELNRRCELCCLVPNNEQGDTARSALPEVRVEPVGPRRDHRPKEQAPWPADVLPYTGWLRRALDYLGLDAALARETARRSDDFEAVLGFDLDSLAYLLAARCARTADPRPRIVCDVIDDPWFACRSLPFRQRISIGGLKQAAVVGLLRRRLLGRCDALVVVSPQDADTLAAATGQRVFVVPNGVWLPEEYDATSPREPLVVFTGAMQFPPNAAAAMYLIRRIWPQVLRILEGESGAQGVDPSHVRLAVIGSSPSPRLRRLAERYKVLVTGWVEDVHAWLRRARVAVAPMINGSGVKNKVLEASANACPVVATSLGVKGLPTGERNGLLVADDPDTFARKVAELITNPDRARVIGLAGRSMVSRQYAWPRMADHLLDVIQGREPGHIGPLHDEHHSDPVFACEDHHGQIPDTEAVTHAAP